MWFLLTWHWCSTGLCGKLIVELMSHKTTTIMHLIYSWPSFSRILRIHTPWDAQEVASMNLTLVVKSVTTMGV